MEQCCFIHSHEQAAHQCARCGHGYCVDCLEVVDHKAVCHDCLRRVRIPSEKEAIATILVTSIIGVVALVVYTCGFALCLTSIWG